MDLAMVKQEQGETLRKYMRRFFDKRATVVDVSDKVIDLFQDGLYHHRTFEDFGRRHPSSITHLKDMITSWANEEDKANANTTPSVARASRTRAATATTRGTKAVAATTTRVPIASASQTTLSRLSSALRKTTRRRPLAASKTC
jgi:lysozyme family protein